MLTLSIQLFKFQVSAAAGALLLLAGECFPIGHKGGTFNGTSTCLSFSQLRINISALLVTNKSSL